MLDRLILLNTDSFFVNYIKKQKNGENDEWTIKIRINTFFLVKKGETLEEVIKKIEKELICQKNHPSLRNLNLDHRD